ncbi:MAG: universal stress protein [Gemmataceae bacterium]|nr:universal stress protein [Gemmataceae bacterium]
MPQGKRVLLAVDQSEASRRAVAYVADVLGGGAGFHVGLLHLELPPRMLEWGGSENPEIEDQISTERGAVYRQVEKQALAQGKALLQRFQAILVEKGIQVAVLLVQFEEPLDRKSIAQDILKAAKEREYGTVVVGRHLFSLWTSLFQQHVGEQLVHTGEGITIWVVG